MFERRTTSFSGGNSHSKFQSKVVLKCQESGFCLLMLVNINDVDAYASADADAVADVDADVERCTELVFGGKRLFKV